MKSTLRDFINLWRVCSKKLTQLDNQRKDNLKLRVRVRKEYLNLSRKN